MRKTDEEVWKLCVGGDISSFRELYCRYYPVLFHYGMKFCNNQDIVKDCIQELFVKMIQNHASLSATGYVKGYLLVAFRNKLFDWLAKEKDMEDISEHAETFMAEDIFSSLFDEEYVSDDDVEALKKVLKTLPSRQQEILYLYFIDNLKHEEIAVVMGINYQSSKNLLFRSLSKLRRVYGQK